MAKNKPLKTSAPEAKEYSPIEIYGGYYWLILNVDPNVLIDSIGTRVPEIIPENKFKYPMPDCVKSAIKAKTVMQTLSREEVDRLNKGLTPEHSFYYIPKPSSTYEIDDIFDWLLQDKDVPTLRLANGKEIRTWRDIRELWQEAGIPFQDLREAETFGTRVKISVPVSDEEQYSGEHFYSLESHLAKQHQENLKKLKTLGAGGGDKPASTVRTARQKRDSVTVQIEKKDVTLTRYEALCLMALKKELENKTEYIRPVQIIMKVWPGETMEGKNHLKYHWFNLRKKLETKEHKLPGFEHFPSKYEGYCLGTKDAPYKPPAWFKKIRFPKDLRLSPVVKPNR